MTRIWVLSAPLGQRQQVERLLAGFVLPSSWRPQPHSPGAVQLVVEIPTEPASIASELAKIGAVFEIEGEGERYLHHPGLGILRQEIDGAGEVLIRAGQISEALRSSAGSLNDFERRLRILQGVAWLDLLEPYRLQSPRLRSLPRAV